MKTVFADALTVSLCTQAAPLVFPFLTLHHFSGHEGIQGGKQGLIVIFPVH